MINNGGLITNITDLLDGAEIPFVTGLTTDDDEPIPAGITTTAELKIEIDNETLKALLSLTPSNNCTIGYTTETNIPNRKNKRKRIQKKWIKKYGFKLKTVVMDGFRMNKTSDGDVCTFEAIREI